jgi:hypothetical protein
MGSGIYKIYHDSYPVVTDGKEFTKGVDVES